MAPSSLFVVASCSRRLVSHHRHSTEKGNSSSGEGIPSEPIPPEVYDAMRANIPTTLPSNPPPHTQEQQQQQQQQQAQQQQDQQHPQSQTKEKLHKNNTSTDTGTQHNQHQQHHPTSKEPVNFAIEFKRGDFTTVHYKASPHEENRIIAKSVSYVPKGMRKRLKVKRN
jgi:hypothetical protein